MENQGYLERRIIQGREAGYPQEQIDEWIRGRIKKAKEKGYSDEQIQESLGVYKLNKIVQDKKIVDPITDHHRKRMPFIKRKVQNLKSWAVGEESQIYDFFREGFGQSSTNLVLQYHTKGEQGYDWRKAYANELTDDGAIERLFRNIGTLVGDIPIGVASYLPASIATGPIGGGFVSGFVTDSIKKTYYEALKTGKVNDFTDWWRIYVDQGVSEGLKAGAIFAGSLAGGLGVSKLAGIKGIPDFIGKKFMTTLTGTTLGMTGAGIAINSYEQGKLTLPSKKELVDTTLFLTAVTGGAISFKKGYNMILNTMSKTGQSAKDVTEKIADDPYAAQEAKSTSTKTFSFADTNVTKQKTDILNKELDELKNISEGKETKNKEQLQEEKKLYEELKEAEEDFNKELERKKTKTQIKKEIAYTKRQLFYFENQYEGRPVARREPLSKIALDYIKETDPELAQEIIQRREKLKNLNNELEGKETKNKEQLQKKKKLTEDEFIRIDDEITLINNKLDEFNHRDNPENNGIISAKQIEIENELKDLGAYVKQNTETVKKEKSEDDLMNSYREDYIVTGQQKRIKEKSKFSKLDKLVGHIADPLKIVETIEKELRRAKITPRYAYEAFTNLTGVSGKASAWIDGLGTYNMKTGKTDGEPLINILKKLDIENNKSAIDDFGAYKHAKRVIEKEGQGIDTNVEVERSRQIVEKYKDKYEDISKEFDLIQEKKIQAMVDAELISPELANKIREFNKDYVPMQKLYDPKIAGDKKLGGLGLKQMVGLKRQKEKLNKIEDKLKKAEEDLPKAVKKGPKFEKIAEDKIAELTDNLIELRKQIEQKTKVYDPIEIEIKDIMRMIALAERNKAKLRFFRGLEEYKKKNPNNDKFDFIKEVKPTIQQIKIQRDDLKKIMGEEFVNKLTDDEINTFNIYRAKEQSLKPTEVSVNINGKRKIYDVGDEFFAQSLDRSRIYNKFFDFVTENSFFKIAEGFSKIKKLGITIDPAFGFATSTAAEFLIPLITKSTYKPYYDLFAGLIIQAGIPSKPKKLKDLLGIATKEGRERAKKIQLEFQKSLGRSTFSERNKDYILDNDLKKELEKRSLINEIKPENPVSPYIYPYEVMKRMVIKGVPRVVKKGIEVATLPLTATEKAARIRIKQRRTEQLRKENEKLSANEKLSDEDIDILATYEARSIQDFGRRGASMEAFERINVFMNAAIQGLYAIGKAATTKGKRAKFWRNGFLGLSVPTALLWFTNKDSQTYENLDQFIKDNYWVFIVDEEKGLYFTQRKPWEVGYVFGTLTEQFLNSAFKTDKELVNRVEKVWLERAWEYFTNFIPVSDMANAYLEDAFNRNSFRGNNLRPARFERDLAEFQETKSTTTTAKKIGQFIRDIGNRIGFEGRDYGSPFMVDHYIKQLTGPLGSMLINTMEKIVVDANEDSRKYVKPWNDNTVENLSRMPVVKYFFRRTTLGAEPLNKYWNNYKKTVKYINIKNRLLKQGKSLEDIRMALGDYQNAAVKVFENTHKGMQKGYDAINFLNSQPVNGTMSPQEVANNIDKMMLLMINISKNANLSFENVKNKYKQ